MEERRSYRLGDIVSIGSGLSYKADYLGSGDNLLLGMGCVSFTEKFLKKGARPYSGESDERYSVLPGDIVLATRQQSDNLPILGMPAIIPEDYRGKRLIAGSNLYVVHNHSDIDNRYLFWLLKTPEYINHISSCKTGTTVRMITKKDVESFVFMCPPKENRDRISGFLWSIEDKIDLNTRIVHILNEQAQLLFENWFVDFEPFKDSCFINSELGMIPEGWKVVSLSDVCTCVLGGTPSRSKPEFWGGDIPWINSGSINDFRVLRPNEFITDLGLKKSATKLLPAKTTVLAITGATLGQVSLLEIDTCANQSVIGVLENKDVPYEFIYPLIVYSIKELISHQTGGAQQHINKQNVDNLRFVLPSQSILNDYKDITKSIYSHIANLCFENQHLISLRDSLLPKLMSGEVAV